MKYIEILWYFSFWQLRQFSLSVLHNYASREKYQNIAICCNVHDALWFAYIVWARVHAQDTKKKSASERNSAKKAILPRNGLVQKQTIRRCVATTTTITIIFIKIRYENQKLYILRVTICITHVIMPRLNISRIENIIHVKLNIVKHLFEEYFGLCMVINSITYQVWMPIKI